MTLPECWPEGRNAPTIIVQLKKALYGLKHALQLWHNNIDTSLHSVKFTVPGRPQPLSPQRWYSDVFVH